ncbi:MAG: ABC transporter substrate-binding protein [Anaerolineae bacterium]
MSRAGAFLSVLVLTSLVAAPVLAGCQAASGSASVEKETLTLTFWHSCSGKQKEALHALIEEFNAENESSIIVQADANEDYNKAHQKLLAAIALGEPPDLALVQPYQMAVYVAADALVPLMENGEWGVEEDDFLPTALEAGRVEGKLFGLPLWQSLEVMFYNIDLLKEADFVGDPPRTWEEFADMCRAVNEEGVTGYAFVADLSVFVGWILAWGGEILHFNEEPGVEALTMLQELFIGGQAYQVSSPDEMLARFAEGKAAFVMDSTDRLNAYIEATAGADFQWSIAPFPNLAQSAPAVLMSGPVIVILAASPERRAGAFRFARWLAGGEQAARLAVAGEKFPASLSAANAEAMRDYLESHPLYAKAFSFLPYGRPEPTLAAWPTVRGILRNAMFDAIDMGRDPREALNDAASKAEAVLNRTQINTDFN